MVRVNMDIHAKYARRVHSRIIMTIKSAWIAARARSGTRYTFRDARHRKTVFAGRVCLDITGTVIIFEVVTF